MSWPHEDVTESDPRKELRVRCLQAARVAKETFTPAIGRVLADELLFMGQYAWRGDEGYAELLIGEVLAAQGQRCGGQETEAA